MNQTAFDKAKLHFENGIKFFNDLRYDLAENEFLFSLQLAPDRLSIIDNLIKVYIKNEDKNKLDAFLKKFQHLKNKTEVRFGLAYKEYFNNQYDKSIEICNSLLNIKEIEIQILDLLASNYKKKKDFLSAIKIYRKILPVSRKNFEIFYNIGTLLFNLGKTKQANFFFKKSNDLNKNHNSTLWNLSLCALSFKDFYNGFLLYETRWLKNNPQIKKFTHIKSANNINEILNKKILIWDEQGLGDTMQFSRFVIQLTKYSKDITLVVNKKLKNLLSHFSPKIKVLDYDLLDEKSFDFQIPICSLPRLLKVKQIKEIPYYKLELPIQKKNILNLNKEKLNIGLAWSGNPNYPNDEYRSIPFKYFYNLLDFKNVNFFKLFKGLRVNELSDFNSYNILDLGEKDFLDLSYCVKELDLVISSDTSIIHLCGILGINSILLLNFNSDWRWSNDNQNTYWYPSVQIIKQQELNNWETVFEQLIRKLKSTYKEKFN